MNTGDDTVRQIHDTLAVELFMMICRQETTQGLRYVSGVLTLATAFV